MNFTRILSISAIILGIYIVFSFFFLQNSTTPDFKAYSVTSPYHIGCYLTQHNTSHYGNIISTLKSLKKKSEINLSKQLGKFSEDYIDSKSLEVAKNFEHFIQQFNRYKNRAQINFDLQRAVKESQDSFKLCLMELKKEQSFSEVDCVSDWEQYLTCSTDLGILKKGLKIQLTERDTTLEKMRALMNNKNTPTYSNNHPTADLLKEYRLKDKQLQDKEKRLEIEAKMIYQRISEAQYRYLQAKNNTLHSRELFYECSKHRKQFRLCEQLSAQVRSLGHGSIQSLGLKVQKKQQSLNQIQKLMNQNEGREASVELKRLFQTNFETHKKLLKLFIQTKARMIKHCGCTESQQLKLKSAMDANLKEEDSKKKDLISFQEKYKKLIEELDKIRNNRKLLLEWLQEETKKLKGSKIENDLNFGMILSSYEKQLGEHEGKIIKLQNDFKALELNCNDIKARLNIQIHDISKIKDCLNKYQFYLEVKKRYERQAPKDVRISEVLKKKLWRSVDQFTI